MIQALLFDAAGTLIEPAEPVAQTYARLLSPHLGPLDPGAIGAAFGDAFIKAGEPNYADFSDGDTAERRWWREVVECTVEQPVPDEAFNTLFNYYASGTAWRIFPEVKAVLAHASDLGLRCAVVSNFDLRLHPILKELDLPFEQIITSADARARKPSPAIFSEALRRLELDASAVFHVGDSEQADLIGAKAAGIHAYHLQRPSSDLWAFIEWLENHPEFR